MKAGLSPAVSGLLGGMGGGIAQAYATMGEFSSSTGLPVICGASRDAYDFCRLTASASRYVASN